MRGFFRTFLRFGLGLFVLAASNTFAGSISASSFTGSGAGLTGLNASNLSTGTGAVKGSERDL